VQPVEPDEPSLRQAAEAGVAPLPSARVAWGLVRSPTAAEQGVMPVLRAKVWRAHQRNAVASPVPPGSQSVRSEAQPKLLLPPGPVGMERARPAPEQMEPDGYLPLQEAASMVENVPEGVPARALAPLEWTPRFPLALEILLARQELRAAES